APDFFSLDIPSRDAAEFRAFLARSAPNGKIEDVPMMRGRIVALTGVPASKIRPPEDAAWALDGDRGITYGDTVPEGSTLTEGAWWSAEQDAKPLVSFE
ncbi:ABC transporter permease, partial [Methylobacterium mesophilicum]